MITFFSLVILIYSFGLLYATNVYKRMPEITESGKLKSVSLIIPFRNEKENLSVLIKSIQAIDYPKELLEILFIDDHSEDDGASIIERSRDSIPFQMKLLKLSGLEIGKKAALNFAVNEAKHEIILTTDADCTLPSDLISKMQAPFELEHINLVSGNVSFISNSLVTNLFQMEFAPLIGVGAVSIELGNPNMANGANLAFRKSIFKELDPYSTNLNVPSGDDIFLLQKLKKAFPNSFYFQKEALVKTSAPKNLRQFYNQKKRWAAKWRASADLKDAIPALMVWSFHLIYICSLIYSVLYDSYLVLGPVILLKIMAEGLFIYQVLKSQKSKFSITSFGILQLIYSLYVVVFGMIANFGSYQWKERQYNTNERAGN